MSCTTTAVPDNPSYPQQIDVTARVSSEILHKHNVGLPFTLTLAVTLPVSKTGPNKPLTVFTQDTLLDPKSLAFFKDGFDLISAEGYDAPESPKFTRCYGADSANWVVCPENEHAFLTLVPGETLRITHMFKVLPRHSPRAKSDNVPWVSPFARLDGLKSGTNYFVGLGDSMSQIRWYRTGTKQQVLGGEKGLRNCLSWLHCFRTEKPRERIGPYNQPPIRLVMKNRILINVEE